jgi:hypothetical protein
MAEREHRHEMWQRLLDLGGPDDVTPALVRDLGIYGGAQGVWVDTARTGALTDDGVGVTVGVLHTGQHYPDDLSADRLLYHYPDTTRRGRDKAEINATKNAATMELPLFVILHGSRDNLRTVRRGTIVGWDDELSMFRIALDAPLPTRLPRRVQPRRRALAGAGATYRRPDEDSASKPRDPFTIDPDKIDRGLKSHARTQNALFDWLAARGIEGLSPDGQANYDIAWRHMGRMFVGEVKSLTNANEAMQLRLGLGQVLDYAEMLRAAGEPEVQPVLVAERLPSDFRWRRVCERAGVTLTWPDEFDERLTPAN